ncbi:hypothetical protein OROMI_006750 [Orobanche minor]
MARALRFVPPPVIRTPTFRHMRQLPPTANGDGEDRLPQLSSANWTEPLANFAANNFLPLGMVESLVSGVLLGLANPTLGWLADTYYLSKLSTFGIFIISGLTLHSNEISAAAEAWPIGIFGLASISFITPLFSRIILLLKLQPQEFVTVALTRIPFSISKFICAGIGVSVPMEKLLISLLLTLLVPLILGKKLILPPFHNVADFADRNRKLLAVISAIFLSFSSLDSGQQIKGTSSNGEAISISCMYRDGNICGGSKSPFAKKENTIALLLVASQKTLPVMVAVVEQLGGALGESGLLVLPCVAAHLTQIIIDSCLVSFWKFENVKVP